MKDENDLFRFLKNAAIIYIILVQIQWLFWFTVGLFRKETAIKHWIVVGVAVLIYFLFLKDFLRL
jgi:hypothetical protein